MMWPDENKLIATFSIWSIKICVLLVLMSWRNQALAKFFAKLQKVTSNLFLFGNFLLRQTSSEHFVCVCFFYVRFSFRCVLVILINSSHTRWTFFSLLFCLVWSSISRVLDILFVFSFFFGSFTTSVYSQT